MRIGGSPSPCIRNCALSKGQASINRFPHDRGGKKEDVRQKGVKKYDGISKTGVGPCPETEREVGKQAYIGY